MIPFSIQAARGVIRDQSARRWTMFVTLVGALVLLFAGSTFLQTVLVEHPVWFVFFWFVCAWLTLAAVLLALFDLLMLRMEARALRKKLRGQISPNETEVSQNSDGNE